MPSDNPVAQTEVLLIAGLLEHNWAVVVPDYEGPNPAYTGGIQAAHAVLDGIGAAERYAPAGLAGAATPVALWGYSGGAQATTWSAELARSYAPTLDVNGAAAGGIPVNVGDIANHINGGPFSGIYLDGVVGLSRAYPQLAALLQQDTNAAGKAAIAQVGGECNATITTQYAFTDIDQYFTVPHPLTLPVARAVIAADALGQHVPATPLYLYQAVNDELVVPADVDALVTRYCSEGVSVDYQGDLFSEHVLLVGTGAPAALAWLQGRLAPGASSPTGCTTATTPSTLLTPAATAELVTYLAGLIPLFL